VQTLGRQELDSNVLKSALLQWHVLHVPKLVLTHCVGEQTKSPYATYGAVSLVLRRCHVTVDYYGLAHSGDDEQEISQKPTSQFEVEPRSIVWDSFTVKSACEFPPGITQQGHVNF